jgi:DNA-binding transcriptional LysR family regulator
MLAAAALVAGTDAITTVNGAFARAAARLMPVKARPVPLPLPRVTVAQAWHPRFDRDPAHVWLRRTVKALCDAPMFGTTP